MAPRSNDRLDFYRKNRDYSRLLDGGGALEDEDEEEALEDDDKSGQHRKSEPDEDPKAKRERQEYIERREKLKELERQKLKQKFAGVYGRKTNSSKHDNGNQYSRFGENISDKDKKKMLPYDEYNHRLPCTVCLCNKFLRIFCLLIACAYGCIELVYCHCIMMGMVLTTGSVMSVFCLSCFTVFAMRTFPKWSIKIKCRDVTERQRINFQWWVLYHYPMQYQRCRNLKLSMKFFLLKMLFSYLMFNTFQLPIHVCVYWNGIFLH